MWKKLKRLLDDRGLNVTDLARLTGLPTTSIFNMKHHDIGFSKMERIADVLGVSLDEFRKEKE